MHPELKAFKNIHKKPYACHSASYTLPLTINKDLKRHVEVLDYFMI
jgi:hypothetical protein